MSHVTYTVVPVAPVTVSAQAPAPRNGLMPVIAKNNGHRYVFDSRVNQFQPLDMQNAQNVFKIVVPLVVKHVVPFVKDLVSQLREQKNQASAPVPTGFYF